VTAQCDEIRDELLDLLYGEATPAAEARVRGHLAVCAACAEELRALRRVRRQLRAWPLPGTARRAGRRFAAGLAAAAALVLAVGGGLALAGLELRYPSGAVALRVGRADVAALERRLDAQDERQRESLAALAARLQPAAATRDDAALLARLEEQIRQSEARQALLLSHSLAELSERTEAQRRYDLARVSASLSYLDGKSGEQLARTSEIMGYVLQAAERR
jgi:hypothetical protein